MKFAIPKNKMKLCALLMLTLLLFSLFALFAGAEEKDAESDADKGASSTVTTGSVETTGTADALPEGQFAAEKKDRGFFNTIIFWRENGGIVCDVFGEKSEGTIDGNPATGIYVPWTPFFLTYLLMIAFSYVVGSLNFGVIVSKKLYKEDVRSHGSGNAGMTNVLRVYGKKAAIMTFLGDFLKGTLCAFLGSLLAGNGCGFVALACCMVGHAFPVFFKFKGGKAVACTFGGIAALEPLAALILFFVFATIVLGTKYVSLGSIIAAALIPLTINMFWRIQLVHRLLNWDYFVVMICSVFFACFIIWLHRANMKRLYEGKENKTYFFKKKEKTGESE